MSLGLVYAEFDILCLILMAMIMVVTMSLSKKLVYQWLYLLLMAFAILIVASDLVYELHLAEMIHIGIPVLYIVNSIYFIASIMLAYTWFSYSQRLAGDRMIEHFRFRLLMFTPVAFTTIAIVLSYKTKWVFYFDEAGVYYRGTQNWIAVAFPLFYFMMAVLWSLVDFIRNNSERTRRNLHTTLSFVLFPIATTATQMVFFGAPMVCIGAVLGMLWIFITSITAESEKMAAGQMIAETKSQFFASMSHELRTPINAVLGMNTMILRESTEDNILEYAHIVENSGKMLLSTVNDILDFSKAESGKLSLVVDEYNTAEMIRDLIMMIRGRAEDKGLEFIPAIDKNLPSVLVGDDMRIKQIVVNLLTNAVKYTNTGSVTLRVGYRNVDADTIRLHVSVVDTGRGIRQEDMKILFSPYSRLNEGLNRKVEGTGLGMSIVQKLLALMDSEIKVESEFGSGSTFSFSILQGVKSRDVIGPIDNILVVEHKKMTGHHLFTAESARVLSVDDTVVNLAVFKGLLKKTGIQIDTATSGEESLQMVQKQKYDIIFMDHMMPGMDGVQALHRMRSDENNVSDSTPIIVLTANVVAGYREMFLSEGFTDFLPKPLDVKVLESMLVKYLPEEKIKYLD